MLSIRTPCDLPSSEPWSNLLSTRERLDRLNERNPLPEGTLAVGTGLLLNGFTTYAFLVLAARALGTEQYAPLSVLWALVFLVGPGLYLPLEQETSRALADRMARGLGGGPLVRRAMLLGLGLTLIPLAATLAANGLILEHLLDDQFMLFVAFALSLVSFAVVYLARGVLSGMNRFRSYATYMGAEGTGRLLVCIVLMVLGVSSPGPFGLAVALTPLVAIAIAMRGQHGLVEPGPESPWSELSTAILSLLAGSLLAQLLVNAGPLTVELLAKPSEEAAAGRFLAGVIVARIPLFLFQAVQAALLPKLSALAGAGELGEFRNGLGKLLRVVVAIGVIATLGAFAVGPWALRLFFGPEFDLTRQDLGLLALGSAAYMMSIAMAQALIALSGHLRVASGWLAGIVGFVVVAALGHELFLRVELGLLAGSALAALTMGLQLVGQLRRGAIMTRSGIIEALHDLPMEP
ncbi:MAG: hypothetical protein HYZ59_01670 [Actinobacteria bacterium]|nr:hypothetical protein [Actinomycetota bacterium]